MKIEIDLVRGNYEEETDVIKSQKDNHFNQLKAEIKELNIR